jgi:hypothetical protein
MEALILLSKEEGLSAGERRLIRDLLGPDGCRPTSRVFRRRAPFGASAWVRVAPLVASIVLLGILALRLLA